MARNVDISEICDEILLHVLDLLKIDDILRMSCVCKRFNRLAHDQSLHRYVFFGFYPFFSFSFVIFKDLSTMSRNLMIFCYKKQGNNILYQYYE